MVTLGHMLRVGSPCRVRFVIYFFLSVVTLNLKKMISPSFTM